MNIKAGVHMLETDWEASLGQLDDVVSGSYFISMHFFL